MTRSPLSFPLAGLLLAALFAGAPALTWADEAEEEAPASDESDAARAIRLSGRLGLTGFQDMVDARTPATISVRGGLRYDVFVQDNDFNGAIGATRKRQVHDFSVYAGGSLLGLVDVAARIPWSYRRDETNLKAIRDFVDRDRGWADFDLAAKVSLSVWGPITVAPYVHGRFPTGEPQVRDLLEFEYGAAATASLFNDYLSIHANVAGFNREEGLMAVRYRLGASFVLWSEDFLLLRAYAYGDGIEFEGRAESDIDLEFGAQAILMGFLSVEIGASTRLLDAGFLDETTKDALRARNVFDRHFEDDGTWQVHLAVGVVF